MPDRTELVDRLWRGRPLIAAAVGSGLTARTDLTGKWWSVQRRLCRRFAGYGAIQWFGLPAYGALSIEWRRSRPRDRSSFRTIGRSEPRDWDLQSDREKGRPRGPQQDHIDYVGLSVFGTENAARENAVRFPKTVARVHLEEGCGFMIARTCADVDEHYTVWGDPDELLARVEQPVSRFDEEPS